MLHEARVYSRHNPVPVPAFAGLADCNAPSLDNAAMVHVVAKFKLPLTQKAFNSWNLEIRHEYLPSAILNFRSGSNIALFLRLARNSLTRPLLE